MKEEEIKNMCGSIGLQLGNILSWLETKEEKEIFIKEMIDIVELFKSIKIVEI
ncbi:MAG: hypothetical protein AB1774_12350 [Bacillota bacterium]